MKGKISNSKGAFASLTGDDGGKNMYDKFIQDTVKIKTDSADLGKFMELYKTRIAKLEPELVRLSKIEEILLQIRAKESIKDIKLSIVRNYIYARTAFYRHDKKVKDVRVVVGKVSDYPQDIMTLQRSRKFISMCKNKLTDVMVTEIANNIRSFKKIYK